MAGFDEWWMAQMWDGSEDDLGLEKNSRAAWDEATREERERCDKEIEGIRAWLAREFVGCMFPLPEAQREAIAWLAKREQRARQEEKERCADLVEAYGCLGSVMCDYNKAGELIHDRRCPLILADMLETADA